LLLLDALLVQVVREKEAEEKEQNQIAKVHPDEAALFSQRVCLLGGQNQLDHCFIHVAIEIVVEDILFSSVTQLREPTIAFFQLSNVFKTLPVALLFRFPLPAPPVSAC
jgi:hypothetical protein